MGYPENTTLKFMGIRPLADDSGMAVWTYYAVFSKEDATALAARPTTEIQNLGILFPPDYRPRSFDLNGQAPSPEVVNPVGANILEFCRFATFSEPQHQLIAARALKPQEAFYNSPNPESNRYGVALWFIANAEKDEAECNFVRTGEGGTTIHFGDSHKLPVPAM